ncbi:winged helix-turn-helix domain-containing protein [Streptomyces sp. NBC_01007]|nr:winged helix-turn-helix domain-containing protein [Streptomyces sp. NBC_01007]
MPQDAVIRFEAGERNKGIVAALRVSESSTERWWRQWREGGAAGVASKGSPGRPRLSDAEVARLEGALEHGPLAFGWADQRWTLTRVTRLIGRHFRISYTVEGAWRLLKRHRCLGISPRAERSTATTTRCSHGRKRVFLRSSIHGQPGG